MMNKLNRKSEKEQNQTIEPSIYMIISFYWTYLIIKQVKNIWTWTRNSNMFSYKLINNLLDLFHKLSHRT